MLIVATGHRARGGPPADLLRSSHAASSNRELRGQRDVDHVGKVRVGPGTRTPAAAEDPSTYAPLVGGSLTRGSNKRGRSVEPPPASNEEATGLPSSDHRFMVPQRHRVGFPKKKPAPGIIFIILPTIFPGS